MSHAKAQAHARKAINNAMSLLPYLDDEQRQTLLNVVIEFTAMLAEVAKDHNNKVMPWVDDALDELRKGKKGKT